MSRPPEPGRLARLAVLASAVAFATTGTARAKGPPGTTPLGVGAVRIAVGAAGLALYVAWRYRRQRAEPGGGAPWRPARGQLRSIVAGGLGVALYQPMFFAGTERCGVAVGTIVALGSGPMLVGLWEGVALRRWPGRQWMAATALALVGGSIVVAAASGDGSSLDALGVACALAAGAGYATYASAAKSLVDRGAESGTVMAWFFTLGAVLLAPALAVEPLDWLATTEGIVMALHLGLVTVTVAYLLYGYGLRSLSASTAATLTLAEPVVAALLGVIVLDEHLPPVAWLGAAVVVAGLALAGLRPPLSPGEPGSGSPAVPRRASWDTPAARGRR